MPPPSSLARAAPPAQRAHPARLAVPHAPPPSWPLRPVRRRAAVAVTVRAATSAASATPSTPTTPTPKTAAFLCVLALSGAALIPPLQEIGGAAERAYQAAGAPLRLLRRPLGRGRPAPPPRIAEAVAQLLLALLSVGPFVALAFVSGGATATTTTTTATPSTTRLALTAAGALLLPAYLRLALLLCGCRPSSAAGQAAMLSASAVRLLVLGKVAFAALVAAPAASAAWAAAAGAVSAAVSNGVGRNEWQQLASALVSPLHPSVALQAVFVPLAVGVWALASFARPASGWWGRRRSGGSGDGALAASTPT